MPDTLQTFQPPRDTLPVSPVQAQPYNSAARADTVRALPSTGDVAPALSALLRTDTTVCRELNAPVLVSEPFRPRPLAAYTKGIELEPRPAIPGYDSMIMCGLIVLFIFMAASVSRSRNFVKSLFQSAFSIRRRRTNVFDEPASNGAWMSVSLMLLVCFCEGILVYGAAHLCGVAIPLGVPEAIAMCVAVSLAYYLFQLAAYSTVGSVFTGSFECAEWLRGFNGSQGLLGILLVIPALVSLFEPGSAALSIAVGAGLYLIARIVFIVKGIRIFYKNIFSCVYFILYLCTLEIIPPLFILRTSATLDL
ncbi:MAG: DUF4271 domain-containing protein [Clostridium sp.]|nr:DUF4271 domain-containing protein [Clostridium sp.]